MTVDESRLITRLVPAIAAIVAILAGVNAIDATPVGVFYDDAHYVILGKSIASGSGYRYINLPNAPAATHFPPGYPALLALLWRVSPSFPENIALFRMVNAVLLGVVAFWVFWIARRLLRQDAITASLAALASTATIPPLLLSSNILSETLFLALLLPYLVFVEESYARPGIARAATIGVGAAVMTLFRSHGIVLLPAVAALYLMRKRWREAAASIGTALLSLLPWLLWLARHDSDLPASIRGQYGSYGAWFFEGLQTNGVSILIDTLRQNIATIYEIMARSFSIASNAVLDALAVTALLVLVVAGAIDFAGRWKAALLFMGLYIGLVLFWPFSPLRFVWGIWPLIVLLTLSGVRYLWTATSPRFRMMRRVSVAVAGALTLVGTMVFNVRGYANSWWATVGRSIGPRIQPQLVWASERTDSTDVVAASDDGAIYLYTGRKAVPVSAFTAQQYLRSRSSEQEAVDLAAIVEMFSPQYVLAWAIPTQQAASLLARRPSPLLAPVDTIPGGRVFRRVSSREEQPRNSEQRRE